jgi:D-tagatose-1,6-bisphosphate aldolase subunit GatZ/KbaZ
MKMGGNLLVESTCNQVNQYGGYTGLTPREFRDFVHRLAAESGFPPGHLLLGGDHLGPNPWQDEPTESAILKAEELVRDCVRAGYRKIHLDASMRLGGDDPSLPLDVEQVAERTARLAKIAEDAFRQLKSEDGLRYVIGSEVPTPGGATEHEQGVSITRVEDVRHTLEAMQQAFRRERIECAWERVIAMVVQPGVEFGDDFVYAYDPAAAQGLSSFIESTPFVYEAHSTDYQSLESLMNLVRDHFAILKVGPALTYAFREAAFALAAIEDELLPSKKRSHLVEVLEHAMLRKPEYWVKHYHGSEQEIAYARKHSLSDRIRYYWAELEVQAAFDRMLTNLGEKQLLLPLLEQHLPGVALAIREGKMVNSAEAILLGSVERVLEQYKLACE